MVRAQQTVKRAHQHQEMSRAHQRAFGDALDDARNLARPLLSDAPAGWPSTSSESRFIAQQAVRQGLSFACFDRPGVGKSSRMPGGERHSARPFSARDVLAVHMARKVAHLHLTRRYHISQCRR